MTKRTSILALLLFLLLAACTTGEPAAENVAQSDGPVVTVYRAPS